MLDLLERLPQGNTTRSRRCSDSATVHLRPVLVGVATLSLFAEMAERQPLACIVDAQWLDQASAQVWFVARRLLAERVALVGAARTAIGDGVLAGLPELSVGPLSEIDARALLLEHPDRPLDATVCDQIVAESHGNPLALLEFPRS
jgi:hypothetical protein